MGNTLKERISNEVKSAMRAKQSIRLGALRLLQAAIKQMEVDHRVELTDSQIVGVIEKQAKQRKESISAFEAAGRAQAAEQENAELLVLQEFLPRAASESEIDAVIDGALASVAADGVSGAAAMGRVMALVKTALAGKADMSAVSNKVKNKLSSS
ncbi:MAG: GatB/YqeY domain-containing protein [Candidimonas sp.]